MELHSPEHPIRSLRAFAVHMLTVTFGILIALGLEQAVVHVRAVGLARHARADFLAELAANAGRVEEARRSDARAVPRLDLLIAFGEALLKHPVARPAEPQPDDAGRVFLLLGSSAWEIAVATQALDTMSLAQAHALAFAYNRQAALNDLDSKARDQWIQAAWLDQDAQDSDAEIRAGLAQLQVARAYALSLEALEVRVLEAYRSAQAALVRK